MKKILAGVLLLVACDHVAQAQAKLPFSPAPSTTKDEQEILSLSTTKWKWMADKNVDSLKGLFATFHYNNRTRRALFR